MKALLWKDFRVNQLVLIVAVTLMAIPFLTMVTLNLYAQWRHGEAMMQHWPHDLAVASTVSLGLSLVTIAMLGGNAVAGERADRSAEFLAYLPPSRRAIITSKATLAIGTCAFIWVVNIAVSLLIVTLADVPKDVTRLYEETIPFFAATSVLLFGAAWFGSSFLASPAIATGIGFTGPFAVGGVLMAIDFFRGSEDFTLTWLYNAICPTLGILGFVAGTVYYIRRVEP